jgi:hypothetical protein
MRAGGGALPCRECDGMGELEARVTIEQLREMAAL